MQEGCRKLILHFAFYGNSENEENFGIQNCQKRRHFHDLDKKFQNFEAECSRLS